MAATLVLLQQGREITRLKLLTSLVTIGRDKRCDISLEEPSISPLHAHLLFQNSRYTITDLSGKTGIRVNGRRVKKCILKSGDIISLGESQLKFIEREEILSEVEEKEAKFQQKLIALSEIAETLGRIKEHQALLNSIMDLAVKELTVQRGFILLYNDQRKLELAISRNMKEELCAKEIILSQTIIQQVCSSGEPIFIPDTQSDRKFKDTESILTQGVRSILAVPLKDKKQQLLGILYLDSRFPLDNFSLAEQSFIMSFATLVSIAIENDLLRKKEKEAIRELARLEAERKYSYQIKKLETEKTELKRFLQEHIQTEIIGTSPAMEAVFSVIRKVAQSDLTILIEGETGTGKELIARAVHQKSLRQGKPFVVINCAAIPENLLESELFGYEKGAFTDAKNSKAGKFELAHQGTIFLDEITELPLSLQVKLLRVLQEQEIERLGSLKPRPVDIRVIAASNKDVAQEVKNGRFRDDLFWRLNVVQIKLPPLRARGDDILLLANYFLEKFTREYQKEIRGFSRQCQKVMLQYPWPGNIRELENKIRRAVVMAKGEYITEEDLGVIIEPSPKPAKSLREARAELEREMIQSALAKHAGNQTQAAQELGLNRRTFIDLMRKYGLR